MIKDEGNTLVPGQRIRKVQVYHEAKKNGAQTTPNKRRKKSQRNNMERLGRKSN